MINSHKTLILFLTIPKETGNGTSEICQAKVTHTFYPESTATTVYCTGANCGFRIDMQDSRRHKILEAVQIVFDFCPGRSVLPPIASILVTNATL